MERVARERELGEQFGIIWTITGRHEEGVGLPIELVSGDRRACHLEVHADLVLTPGLDRDLQVREATEGRVLHFAERDHVRDRARITACHAQVELVPFTGSEWDGDRALCSWLPYAVRIERERRDLSSATATGSSQPSTTTN